MNQFNKNIVDPNKSGSLQAVKQSEYISVKKYYLTGVALVLVLVVINSLITINLISLQSGSALLINISGRQRMLSQRIALVSELIYDDINYKDNFSLLDHQKELSILTKEIADKNKELQSGFIGTTFYFYPSDKILEMYTGQPFDLNNKLSSYLESANTFQTYKLNNKAPNANMEFSIHYLINNSSEVLNILDAIVSQYDNEYSLKINYIKDIQTLLTFIIIVTLFIKVFFIFRPMERKILWREDQLISQITIRHKAEATLKETQYSYKLLAANLPNLSFMLFDKDLRYILAGGPFLEKSGYKKEEVEGRTLREVIKNNEVYEKFKSYYEEALNGKTNIFEGITLKEKYNYHTQITPLIDTEGHITGGIVVTENVTEQNLIEKQLKDSQQNFNDLANNIDTAFWLASPDGTDAHYINPAFEKIYGKNVDELYSNPTSFSEMIHPEDKDIATLNRESRINNNKYNVEYRIVKKNGEIRWVWARAFPIKDKNGNIIRTAGIIEDITDKKVLEHKAVELGIERETIKILANFIRDTAHDLRTPLTIIRTSSYLLNKITDTKEQHRHINTINKQVEHLRSIIDQLHSMSQIDVIGKYDLKPTNVKDIVKNVYHNFTYKAREKNLNHELEISDNVKDISADSNFLYKAIAGIYENAIVYTQDGGNIKINIYENNGFINIDVKDSGIGIPKDDIPKIFHRFYKSNHARTSNNTATGLGLSISKTIVEKHGGHIEVESTPGYGSLFKIILPYTIE